MSAKASQKVFMSLIWIGGVVTALLLVMLILYVVIKGAPQLSLDFLITAPQGGLAGEGGISTAIVTTIYLTGLTMLILIPPGICAAIYLTEYARDNWLTRIIRYGVSTLAGVPSIIFGLFGFAIFVTALHFRFSILSGALTLACLLLPTMISTTEEALKTVPNHHRAAALALGATKWQTIRHVIVPAALPGIITGVILCVGRAIGETACLYVTLGSSAAMPDSLLSGGRTLSLHLYYLATDTNALTKAMTTGIILIFIIVVINTLTNWLSRRFHAKMTGGGS
jgi:phosphate transport system permease protein